MIDTQLRMAGAWEQALEDNSQSLRDSLRHVYGNPILAEERRTAILKTLRTFLGRFGDLPVVVFRAPARINLRGMHVDSHGGYLNLMTHQRETVVVAALKDHGRLEAVNSDPAFREVSVPLAEIDATTSWPEIVAEANARKTGEWSDYLLGCAARLAADDARQLSGVAMAVSGNVPTGTALSSSSSLCCAVFGALASLVGYAPTSAAWIRAVRGAEWYAGARIGTSDQGAIILCKAGSLTFTALPPETLESVTPRYIRFPEGLAVLVVDTYTSRQLSGRHLLAYTRNRFAYAMALDVLRAVMRQNEYTEDFVAETRHLSDLTPQRFVSHGGESALYALLKAIPVELKIGALRDRFDVPDFDAAYDTYLGGVPETDRPTTVALRGPLLFGIAESLRAMAFAEAIAAGDWVTAGRMMTIGHDGDRLVDSDGDVVQHDVSDEALDAARRAGVPLDHLPGGYGASSPVLDSVVDAALANGALGASLTGAGIAGSVLVLCEQAKVDVLRRALEAHLCSDAFAQRRGEALTPDQADGAVVENVAVAGAGALRFPD